MRRHRLALLLTLAFALLWALPATAGPFRDRRLPIEYTVRVPNPASRYIEVEMLVPGARKRELDVAMPSWTPGSYRIREFGRHVYGVEAESLEGKRLDVRRLDKQTWRIGHRRKGFRLRYRVFADERNVRASHVDDRHASIVGTSVFLYLAKELERPCTVKIELPPGWTAHSALAQTGSDPRVPTFAAPGYDELVDAPIELGTPEVRGFEAGGAKFDYVLTATSGHNADVDRLAADSKTIVEAFGRMMGGFPFARYVFLVSATQRGGGGLEHADSTSMMVRAFSFGTEGAYARHARLVAHEFFHLWNVKRIHDRVLGPFDYSQENYSRLLWFHEGFTETMEAQALVRSGMVAPEQFLENLAKAWTRYLRRPGRNLTPIAQLSAETWIKHYQDAANHPNVVVSYYEKGNFIGVALDLEIRLRSRGKGSLIGVFRRLMRSHGRTNKGIEMADLVAATSAEAGTDMQAFFDRYVEGTDEIPLPELLARVGIRVETSAPWERTTDPLARARKRAYSGIDLRGGSVHNVIPGSPAEAAGVMLGDEIIAVSGRRASGEKAIQRIADHAPGDSVELAVFRDGRLERKTVVLAEDKRLVYSFELDEDPKLDPTVKQIRDAWLEVY